MSEAIHHVGHLKFALLERLEAAIDYNASDSKERMVEGTNKEARSIGISDTTADEVGKPGQVGGDGGNA